MGKKTKYNIARRQAENFYAAHKSRIAELMRNRKEPAELQKISNEYMRLKMIEQAAYEELYRD